MAPDTRRTPPLTPDQLAWLAANGTRALGLMQKRLDILLLILRQAAQFSLGDLARLSNKTLWGARQAFFAFEDRGIIILHRERQGGTKPDLFLVEPGPLLLKLLPDPVRAE
jgi:hypothetical protein